MILTAQALALYVVGCCIGGIVGCNAKVWKDAFVTVGDCATTSALGCSMQMTGACEIPSIDGPGWDDYRTCLGDKAQSCAVQSIARCAISGLMKAFDGPIIGGGTPCDIEEVDLCIMGEECNTERACAETVATCYKEVCTR